MRNNVRVLIKHGRLVTPCDVLDNVPLVIRCGKIVQVGGDVDNSRVDKVIDAAGRLVTPGFLDLHVQGAGGADVLEGTPEAISTIARSCLQYGVTGFLATTNYFPGADNSHIRNAAELTGQTTGGAALLGLYLESPFISREKLGMIDRDAACAPSGDVLSRIIDDTGGHLRIMTVAPEIEGNQKIISRLVDSGVAASFGHSAATYEQTIAGFEYGIRHVTHLFNAMPSMHHRSPGPFPAIVETPDVIAEVICDGAHLHPSVVKLALNVLGADRFALITDGMKAMGLPDGTYEYHGLKYTSKNGIARHSDGTLMGTATGISQLIKRCLDFSGLPLPVIVRAAALTPAKILGIDDKKGSIEKGKDADIAILNEDFSVWKTIIEGETVFEGGY